MKRILVAKAGQLATAGALLVGTAQAADMQRPPPPPPLLPAPSLMPVLKAPTVDAGGGWYLRGDVGVGRQKIDGWYESTISNAATANGTYLEFGVGDTAFAGVGLGYEINDFLRADATIEYRIDSDVHALVGYTLGGGPRYNMQDGEISSTVMMVNGYLDLGTWRNITPFVGGGIGVAHNRMSQLRDWDVTGAGGGGYYAENENWNFAWALAGGLGYEVNDNLSLEVGYRYLNLGDVDSGGLNCVSGTGAPSYTACGSTATAQDLTSHDFKIGMRWRLGADYDVLPDLPPPPPPGVFKH